MNHGDQLIYTILKVDGKLLRLSRRSSEDHWTVDNYRAPLSSSIVAFAWLPTKVLNKDGKESYIWLKKYLKEEMVTGLLVTPKTEVFSKSLTAMEALFEARFRSALVRVEEEAKTSYPL